MIRKMILVCIGMVRFSPNVTAGDKGLMGALIGAGAGAAIGHSVDRSGGAGKGAAIGAIGGYIIGSQLDKNGNKPAAQHVDHSAGTSLSDPECRQGKSYFERSQRASDIEDKVFYLQQAVRFCPANARVHNDLGVAYYHRDERHDRERARIEFREALRINPDYAVAKSNLDRL